MSSFYVSAKKPNVPKKPEIKLEFNNKSYESYIDTGFPNIIPQIIRGPYNRIQKFLNKVDLRKGPIDRSVISMVRLKAIDWNTKKHETKEYIYYEERWEANDWLGNPILNPIDGHIEGRYTEVVTTPKFDQMTGDHIDNLFKETREVYYIPFSKTNVDEIIKNSARTNRSNIRFTVKFGREDSPDGMFMSSRNQFSYDMFLWPWEKLCEYQYWPVDDLFNRPKAFKPATGTKLEFKPS